MTDIAINVEQLGKRYRYGGVAPLSENLRADVSDWLRGWFRNGSGPHQSLHDVRESHQASSPEYFWALKDVNIAVQRGDLVGVIGRNGAGKSTLLKILSRITPPTTGSITYRGRVASLLEVGTGFHRELTGRENIFLNGSILGMPRREITRKFDEILAFAEVEKFIDTPVKFYSSGMYVRLAFAVAAHLEPEILLVDEVLAVGDAAFQRKCLGKMGSVAKEGRTVLFVSHNMGAVQHLCKTVVWIDAGHVRLAGPTATVTAKYLESSVSESQSRLDARVQQREQPSAHYAAVRLLDGNGAEARVFPSGTPLTIEARVRVNAGSLTAQCGLDVLDSAGLLVTNVNSRLLGHAPLTLSGESAIRWEIKELRLVPGRYSVNLRLKDANERDLVDFVENAATFEVMGADVYASGQLITAKQGVTYLPITLRVG